ncbi:MAG: polyprenyl synthetase family protein [Clostridiales bacterium]|nr:polyprenyl synthetase family protein [Clostridiales bacterium]
MAIEDKIKCYRDKINDMLKFYMKGKDSKVDKIYEVAKYSLISGGKRIRPVLMLLVGEMFGVSKDKLMPFACALEMIHTYSLIHDDLPAMDNDDYRRGHLTNHKVYGEAMAILSGDALLNKAYEIMLDESLNGGRESILAAKEIANSAGMDGMIGGQVKDLEIVGKVVSADELEYVHKLKTGCLIKASVMAAAHLANATHEEKSSLDRFSQKLGLAFQIKDDILDVIGDKKSLGKSVGKDKEESKTTYVSVYGLNQAMLYLEDTTNDAIASLRIFGDEAKDLVAMAEYLLNRKY